MRGAARNITACERVTWNVRHKIHVHFNIFPYMSGNVEKYIFAFEYICI